ncbi:hypothetical protein DFH06DRAFT_54274 [Mycena polygramma]|nr:hypothetical protein DFH06DRAFT_54274 [Mycena polygramma]
MEAASTVRGFLCCVVLRRVLRVLSAMVPASPSTDGCAPDFFWTVTLGQMRTGKTVRTPSNLRLRGFGVFIFQCLIQNCCVRLESLRTIITGAIHHFRDHFRTGWRARPARTAVHRRDSDRRIVRDCRCFLPPSPSSVRRRRIPRCR